MFRNYSYLMSLGHMCSDMPQGALAAMLPTLIAMYHYDYTTAATLMMVFSIAGSFVQPIFGALADKWNQPLLIILALMMADGAMCVTGFLSNYWALVGAIVISGVGVALFHPQAALTVNKLSTSENRGKNLSIFSFGGQMGFALGPIIATTAIHYIGIRGTVAIALPAIVVCLLVAKSIPQLEKIGQNATQKAKSRAMGAVNNWRGFAVLGVCTLGRSVIYSSMNTFLALYCINILGLAKTLSASILSGFFVISAVATLLGGNLADRFGFRFISRCSFALLMPSLIVLAIAPSAIFSLIALIPIGISISLSYSPMVVLGQLYLPKRAGLAAGVTLGLSVSIGGIFAPLLGKIGDLYGLSYTFYTIAAVSVIPLIMSFLLPEVEGDCEGCGLRKTRVEGNEGR